ncbi:putative phage-associated protein [Actinocorallia herbida]|uniref:Putative phage-associated protein n=1 Tax=Actinocorallia herbida TaxID=58109 RepID=A0A3N1D3Y1_9ACTN|nr:type II toxin-antitoxin system antitoxin SocA domain-containing protein [Actinocorallia herbida]ROO88244.1 putative phage-associated protein [Actinocorallia herbida]
MATIKDVAAHILRRRGPMTAMKLQKLAYFAYGYHLIWEERRLFPERFEAWANGPVSPVLYGCHRGRFHLQPGEIPGDPDALDAGERESVDLVIEGLGELTAHQLSTMTHESGPWVSARQRDDAHDLERSSEELRDDEIAEYFDALSAADGQA